MDRRTFIGGGALLLATPALVRAASLDYVPHHDYWAYEEISTGTFDIVRGDGVVAGWIKQRELSVSPRRTRAGLLELAGYQLNDAAKCNLMTVPVEGIHAPPILLMALARM